ncbi:MAG: hypothetical protein TRG1_424 [Flavobacteriaceae bacterium FS1-H7996/R]|nr:MAG: hypothetical protein TRG1_424 [Flavobacteriaceae bacterium FS1-H7996/R]
MDLVVFFKRFSVKVGKMLKKNDFLKHWLLKSGIHHLML